MIEKIQVDLEGCDAQKLLAFLEGMPANILPALLEAVDEGTQVILGKAERERFRGKGPFPVSQRKLGVITGRLRESLFAGKPKVTGKAEVEVSIGSNVKYFGIHEFGFDGKVDVPAHSRRRSNALGRVISAGEAARGGTLKSQVRAHSRRMRMPKRAPLGAAIDEHSQRTYEAVFAEKLAQLLDAQ